ncbi:MAG: hypothetical protein M3O15_05215, partial [Acidobacteriota bacterium]|nr:hypothetical protein [Acidobacteriota bacterium]
RKPRTRYNSGPATQGRGYQPRACGFDMNHNGVFGEPADCHVCDGSTRDPNYDGIFENIVYVSCQTGNDNASCGAPGNPCHSIQYAWNNRTSPAGSPAADIICFRGYCHEESITPGVSGKPGSYTVPQSGTQARDWQLPTHPTMLVGWDYNKNGQYPPYDTQDIAVLDGNGLAQAIRLSANSVNSEVELAHFTVRDYGRSSSSSGNRGFIGLGSAPGTSSHVFIHDLSIQNVNAAQPLVSNNIIFNLFTGNTNLQWLAVDNVQVTNAGGYLARGSGPSSGSDIGPYRFQNISYTAQSCSSTGGGQCADPGSQAHAVAFKLWGYISGIEVLDSIFDLNVGAWTPQASGFGSTAFLAAQCSHDWTIRNNEMRDWKVGLTVQGYAYGYCDGAGARPVDSVVFDRNIFRNTYSPWVFGNNGVTIESGGPNPRTSIGNVLISNNFFSSTPGWQGMIYISAGNNGGPDPANIQILNNTTVANLTRGGFGALTLVKGTSNPPQKLQWKNNIIAGMGQTGEENLHTEYAPAGWDADGNVFDGHGIFTWNGNAYSNLAGWRGASGRDQGSRVCTPGFLNPAAGDFHLVPGDACARSAGLNIFSMVPNDIDGNVRPATGLYDIGAHQVHAYASAPPRH